MYYFCQSILQLRPPFIYGNLLFQHCLSRRRIPPPLPQGGGALLSDGGDRRRHHHPLLGPTHRHLQAQTGPYPRLRTSNLMAMAAASRLLRRRIRCLHARSRILRRIFHHLPRPLRGFPSRMRCQTIGKPRSYEVKRLYAVLWMLHLIKHDKLKTM